jgi:hypothetical protein
MPFTEEEKRAWHEAKRKREVRPPIKLRNASVTECIHCGQPFGYGEGFISDDVSICDACDGD